MRLRVNWEVPIGFLLPIGMMMFGATWWLATLDNRVEDARGAIATHARAPHHAAVGDRVTRLEVTVSGVADDMGEQSRLLREIRDLLVGKRLTHLPGRS